MLELTQDMILEQTEFVHKLYKERKITSLPYMTYMSKIKDAKKYIEEFEPYEVKIAKDLYSLLKRDLEPSKIIKVDKPILDSNGLPMWYESSKEGIKLIGLGYVNGDSRYPCPVILKGLNSHMFFVGMTGHGKSVATNSKIVGIMRQYAPWEVIYVLIDAKLAEFGKYASRIEPAHVETLAATSDSDYIMSVLEYYIDRMKKYNQVFTKEGVSDIVSFRNKTGLTLPRTLVDFDEVTEGLKNAGKNKDKMEAKLGSFTALGRNTGIHLALSSQTVNQVTDVTLTNMLVRGSLGSTKEVSEKILGNPEAAINFGSAGRLIINMNNANKNVEDNIHIRVPLPTDEVVQQELSEFRKKAEEFGVVHPFSTFDESTYYGLEQLPEVLRKTKISPNKLMLGEPAFIQQEEDNFVSLNFTFRERENICLHSTASEGIRRLTETLLKNMEVLGNKVNNIFIAPNKGPVEDFNLEKYNGITVVSSEYNSDEIQGYLRIFQTQRAAVVADEKVFSGNIDPSERGDYFLEKAVGKDSKLFSVLNRKRTTALMGILISKSFGDWFKGFGVTEIGRDEYRIGNSPKEEEIFTAVLRDIIIDIYEYYDCLSRQLGRNDFPRKYLWFMSVDKLVGIGRDAKPVFQNSLNKFLQDFYMVNGTCILSFTNTIEMNVYKSCFRYYMLENVIPSKVNSIGVYEFPESINPVLSVLYDSEVGKAFKYKKSSFVDENIG
jgi:hypothetical protein